MFSCNRAYVAYGETYGSGMQRREGGASALQLRPSLRCLPLTDGRKSHCTQHSLAVEANNALRTARGAKSAILAVAYCTNMLLLLIANT